MEKNYHVTLLEQSTETDWHAIEALCITKEESRIILEALIKILEQRQWDTEHLNPTN